MMCVKTFLQSVYHYGVSLDPDSAADLAIFPTYVAFIEGYLPIKRMDWSINSETFKLANFLQWCSEHFSKKLSKLF